MFQMSIKVAINGFGRIGRNLLRCSVHNPELEFVAANDLTRPEVLGHLLKYDSVLGRFDGKIDVKEDAIVVNGKPIKIFAEDRKSTRLNSSHVKISYAVFCL